MDCKKQLFEVKKVKFVFTCDKCDKKGFRLLPNFPRNPPIDYSKKFYCIDCEE